MSITASYKLFDSHFHIIDKRFPLVENQGFLPDYFSCVDYLERLSDYSLSGGTIVSGSFQGLDQTYLVNTLKTLGPNYVGVTQLPATVSDEEILKLDQAGVRGVRFNLKRGGSEGLDKLESFARRIYELSGWHTELYVASSELDNLVPLLISLPKVSIAHLGLTRRGLPTLLELVEKGIKIKATGFYRVDFDPAEAISAITAIDVEALFFGTDLPSTRAARPYSDDDFKLVIETLGDDVARQVFYDNPIKFYQPKKCHPSLSEL